MSGTFAGTHAWQFAWCGHECNGRLFKYWTHDVIFAREISSCSTHAGIKLPLSCTIITVIGIKWCNSLYFHLPLLIVCKFLSSSLWGTLVCAMAAKIGTLRLLSLQTIFAYKQKNGSNLLLLVVFSHKPIGQHIHHLHVNCVHLK